MDEHIEQLDGIVDIYPALNPMGIDSITRGIPMFDLDMNRVFPGTKRGTMVEVICSSIVDDLSGHKAGNYGGSDMLVYRGRSERLGRMH